MAASIKGRTVVWGVTAGIITAVQSATESGIIQSCSLAVGGETEIVKDEDGDPVTRIDHGATNQFDFEVMCEPDSVLPTKGSELTGLGTIDGINTGTGRTFVDTAKVDYANTAVKKISGSATHYPSMPADG